MNPRRANRTLSRIIIICILATSMVLSNVIYTMVTKTHFRTGTSVMNYGRASEESRTITASRGYIYDTNQEIIAQDEDTYMIYAILNTSHTGIGNTPAYVIDAKLTADTLAPILGMDVDEVLSTIENGQANQQFQVEFGPKGKNLSTTLKETIDALNLPGIEFSKSSQRFYPVGNFASNLIGYAQYDETEKRIVGKMGLEAYLDEYLTGSDGEERYQKTAGGTILPGTKHVETQAVNGNDVYLTLDKNVQVALEKCMEDTMKAFNSQRAWAVIMEVETGRVLGYSAYPTFNLNERNVEEYLDVPSAYLYEPGSVMKAFTYAAAIDSGNFPYDTTYRAGVFNIGIDANGNAYRSDTYLGKDYGKVLDALETDYGTLTFEAGFMHSSNIAICELMTKYLPPEIYEDYLDRFGFFKPVGMEGVEASEQAGVKNFTYPIEKLAAGYGQGSSVTAMQMVQAYSALFNDGKMVKPYIIDKVVNSYTGDIIEENTTEIVGEPISKETADKMKDLMYSVVNEKDGNGEGTGYTRFHMDDIVVIGKTGTGEIATDGKYGKETYVNSFMGAAPYDDPKVMMYYVFESGDIRYSEGGYFKSAFRQALISLGITGDSSSSTSDGTSYSSWQEYKMPALLNHSLDYVNEKMVSMGVNKVIIGDGSGIVKQYPEEGDTVITNQNVFLLTDGANITMPDMKGWSRKDVAQFTTITGIPITISGSGTVSEQTVSAGTTITAESDIQITLK